MGGEDIVGKGLRNEAARRVIDVRVAVEQVKLPFAGAKVGVVVVAALDRNREKLSIGEIGIEEVAEVDRIQIGGLAVPVVHLGLHDVVDRLAQYADEASQKISSMSDIMNELAEIVRGDLTLLREPDLDTVLIDAISVTVFSINDPNMHLTTDIPVKPPAVLLNRRQI